MSSLLSGPTVVPGLTHFAFETQLNHCGFSQAVCLPASVRITHLILNVNSVDTRNIYYVPTVRQAWGR